MPTLSRDYLALKFRQNWLAKHPNDVATPATGLDDSLTSLNWLQNLNILKIGAPTPPASPPPQHDCLQLNTKDFRVNPNSVLNIIPQIKQEPGTANRPSPCIMEVAPPVATTTMDKVDYKTNPYVKPPYSYATLICMAMRESKKSKITLSGIYNWITENFMYYRMADPSWQNSIRHNLSLNKCFGKVPRRKDEPGKGGFWRINPDYSDMFVNGIFKKRRGSTRENIAPLPKKIKRENEPSSCSLSSQEQLHQASGVLHFGDMEEILKGDFSWNAILNQDIEVGGVRIKTEDIINDTETSDAIDSIASPITSFSPPHSDTTSDSALDDLLSTDLSLDNMDFDPSEPLDLSCGGPLDLTVQGVSIRAPEWWGESFSGMTGTFQMVSGNRSGLSTPSPVPDSTNLIDQHPWAETRDDFDDAIQNAFDVDNLFDIENIPSPNITEH